MKKIIGIVVGLCFGSAQAMAAATCSDQAVIDAFLNRYICSLGMANCSAIGVGSYSELQSFSDEEVKLAVEYHSKMGDAVRGIRSVGTSVASHFADFYLSTFEDQFVAARKVIKSVKAISTSYDARTKTYRCQAEIQFDEHSLDAVTLGMALVMYTQDEQAISALLQNNQESGVTSTIGEIKGEAHLLVGLFKKAVPFTLQPKDPNALFSSEFLIRVELSDLVNE